MGSLGALARIRARSGIVIGLTVGLALGLASGFDPAAGRVWGGDADAPMRVRQTVDVEGQIFAPTGRGTAPVRRPILLTGRFDFVQEPAGSEDGAGASASATDSGSASSAPAREPGAVVRRYLDAVADLRIDGVPSRTVLGQDARGVRVAMQGMAPVSYLAEAPLTREEADLLEVPFDALLLDRLRPAGAPAEGATWKVAADVTAGLLTIDTVETGELAGAITEIAAGRGTLTISGTITGAVDGVPTRLVIEAVGTVPVRQAEAVAADAGEEPGWVWDGPHDQWVATIREQRQASHVAPGFEVEARVAVSRRGAGTGGHARGDGRAGVPPEPIGPRPAAGGPGRIWYRDPAGRFDLVHDARWRLVEEGTTGAVFRFVDRGTLVGQCSITSLPRVDTAAAGTVADVQRDVEASLGGQFGRFTEATEAEGDDGVRGIRVVSVGRAGTLPFRWIHHVVTAPRGQRASAAFMVEESLAERFGAADRDLIAGLRFTPPRDAAAAGAGEPERPADREARLPRETAMP